MLDFAAGIEAKNYGLRKTSDLLTLLDSLKILFPLFVIAGALSFHVWVRSQTIQIGYERHQLINQENDLRNIREHLILEEQTTKNLKKLEIRAMVDLKMILTPADRIIMTVPPQQLETEGSETLALGSMPHTSEIKKQSAFN